MPFYDELTQRLARSDIDYRIHSHAPSVTVVDAETYLDFPVAQLLKTIAFRVKNSGWVLAALCGHSQVDYKKLATFCGVSRDKLIRLTPGEIEQDLGFELGGVAPFATHAQTRVVVDAGAMQYSKVYCGTGRKDRTLEISPSDLVKIAGAAVALLAKI
jgi:Cys-tRNA(Pro)/Cys-tRNA(Cys) deacylase